MKCFPQLTQYPIQRTRSVRTIVNESLDGWRVKGPGSGAGLVEWRMELRNLSDSEVAMLLAFHSATEGGLEKFTFLDPAANLLLWSAGLDQPVWERNTQLEVAGGASDCWGGADGWRIANRAAANLRLEQSVAAPEKNLYCLSAWLRSDGEGVATLWRNGISAQAVTGNEWQRVLCAGRGTEDSNTVTFGIEVPAGATIDVCGVQVEGQAGASGYKATYSESGVFPNARFSQDEMVVVQQAPNRSDCKIRITHANNS